MTETRLASQIWETALGELQIQVNKQNYRTWLSNTSGLNYKDTQFVIGVPSTFIAEYLEMHQRSLIEKVLAKILKREVQVLFKIDKSRQSQKLIPNKQGKAAVPEQGSLPLFNPKYTFESFVVGSNNQLAYAAAQGVAQNPGENYNPLFIFGQAGLGKTHLLQAIGHAALANNINVVYVRAEEYTNQMVTAIREKKTEEFRNKYRHTDILLIDDIQFFEGKQQTAENFFHTFEELHNGNHQIAITSDRPPKSISFLQGRLRSRFEWGLVTDIQTPDFETRLSILQAKADQKEESIPTNVLEYIALQVQQNIRALEGSLNRVLAYANLLRSMLTPELAAQALKNISDNKPLSLPVTPPQITEAVVNCFHLTPSDLRGRKRDEVTALARQVAMYLIRQETDCSLAEIGEELGGRSPATVSHGYQKIATDIKNNPSLRRKVFDIQRDFSAASEKCIY